MNRGLMKPMLLRSLAFLTVVILTVAFLAIPAAEAQGDDSANAKKKEKSLVEAFEEFLTEELEQEGLSVTVQVIPDLYLYRMALAYDEGKKRNLDELEIERELEKVHRAEKKHKGRPLLKVLLEVGANDKHYWLQKGLNAHVNLDFGGKVRPEVENVKGVVDFQSWKIYELNRNRDFTRKIAYFRKLEFEVSPKGKLKDENKDKLELTLEGLLRYTEVEKRSEYERIGINTAVKQLALALWSELEVPGVTLTFYPGKWKLPAFPEGFQKILTLLEG